MTDDTRTKKAGGAAALDVILAGLGFYFGVSTLMAITGNAPQQNAVTRPVVMLMDGIGAWPTMLLGLAVAGVGAWSFLAPRPVPRERHAAGAVGAALGLAIALGGLRAGLGGALGAVLPSLVAGPLGAALGAAVGLGVVLATVWLVWLPEPDEEASWKPGEERTVPAVGTPESASGVTHAEAEALIATGGAGAAQASAAPPRTASPAGDVRTRGGVPEGAQPLNGPYERTPEAPDPARARPGQAAEPLHAPAQRPGADLAAVRPLPGRAARPLEREREAAAPVEPPARPLTGARPLADPELSFRPIWESAEPVPVEPAPEPEPELPPPPPGGHAIWEQPVEGDDEPEDEETFVEEPAERLRWSAEDEPEAAAAPEDDEELELDEDLADEPEQEEVPAEADEEDEEELEPEEILAEEDEEPADEPESEEVLAEEDEELADEPESEEVLAEEDEEPADEPESEEILAEADDEDEEDDLEPEEARPATAGASEPAPQDAESELRPMPRKPRPAAPPSAKPSVVQSSLFDAVDPQSRPEARAPQADPPLPDELEDLVFEAGSLILGENRVAVSMLQRRFGLDFDQATLVLDALQERGLIGPYLGGKTRAILMSREEWAAHAPGA